MTPPVPPMPDAADIQNLTSAINQLSALITNTFAGGAPGTPDGPPSGAFMTAINDLTNQMRASTFAAGGMSRTGLSEQESAVSRLQNRINTAQANINTRRLDVLGRGVTTRELELQTAQRDYATAVQQGNPSDIAQAREELGRREQALIRTMRNYEQEHRRVTESLNQYQRTLQSAPELQTVALSQFGNMGRSIDELSKAFKAGGVLTIGTAILKSAWTLYDSLLKTNAQLGTTLGRSFIIELERVRDSFKSIFSIQGAFTSRQEIGQQQQVFGRLFGGVLKTEVASEMAARAKEIGATPQEYNTALRPLVSITGGINSGTKLFDRYYQQFRMAGLTGRDVSESIAENSLLIARSGENFAESMAKAAAQAKIAGYSLNDIDKLGDRIVTDFSGWMQDVTELNAMGASLNFNEISAAALRDGPAGLVAALQKSLNDPVKGAELEARLNSEYNRPIRVKLENLMGMSIDKVKALKNADTTQEDVGRILDKTANEPMSVFAKTAEKALVAVTALAVLASAAWGASAGLTNLTKLGFAKTVADLGGLGTAIGALTKVLVPLAAGAAAYTGVTAAAGMVSDKYRQAGDMQKANKMESAGKWGGITAGIGTALLTGAALVGVTMSAPAWLTALAVAAGATALAGGIGYAMGDDMVSPPGYGQRSLITESGLVALNNKDTIVAMKQSPTQSIGGVQTMPAGTVLSNPAMASDSMTISQPMLPINTINNSMMMQHETEKTTQTMIQPINVTTPKIDFSPLEQKLDSVKDSMVDAFSGVTITLDSARVGRVLASTQRTSNLIGSVRNGMKA